MKRGDRVDDFVALDENGAEVRMGELLADGPVVLYFYPKAKTPLWTRESCHFRDLAAEFAELGAQRVGISADPVGLQKEFAVENDLDFPLLSDGDGSIHRRFGTSRFGPLPGKRATFVIGADGVVLDVIRSETSATVHADKALEVLRSAA